MTGWSSTPRGKRELGAVLAFALALLVVPPIAKELYPFSIVPMYSGAPRVFWLAELTDPEGNSRHPAAFGLVRNDLGYTYYGVQKRIRTINLVGRVATPAEIADEVRHHMKRWGGPAFLDVTQRIYGPIDDHAFGLTSTRRFRVYAGEAP